MSGITPYFGHTRHFRKPHIFGSLKYRVHPKIPETSRNTRAQIGYPEISDRILQHSCPNRTRRLPNLLFSIIDLRPPNIEKKTRLALKIEKKFLDICVYRKGNSQTLFPCISGKHSGADRSVYSKLPCLLNIYKLLTHVLVHALLPGDSFLEYIYSIEVCGQ